MFTHDIRIFNYCKPLSPHYVLNETDECHSIKSKINRPIIIKSRKFYDPYDPVLGVYLFPDVDYYFNAFELAFFVNVRCP